MSRILATYNIKGGVGKTSAAVNLAYLASREGLRTLLWDLDPQGASTYLFRVRAKVQGGAKGLIRLRTQAAGQIRATDHAGLDLLPADFSYRHMDLTLQRAPRPRRRLAAVLRPLREEYDLIFLDCPPSISLVSESMFDAADALLVPVIPAALSTRTFDQLERIVSRGPRVLAFVSMFDSTRALHRDAVGGLREDHRFTMLGAAIPSSEDVERMGLERQPVEVFAPGGPAAVAYRTLWLDVRRRLDLGSV